MLAGYRKVEVHGPGSREGAVGPAPDGVGARSEWGGLPVPGGLGRAGRHYRVLLPRCAHGRGVPAGLCVLRLAGYLPGVEGFLLDHVLLGAEFYQGQCGFCFAVLLGAVTASFVEPAWPASRI